MIKRLRISLSPMENRNQLYVPDVIVSDILLRLSVQSLVRCRTVSKSWLSIISDPQFIKSHYLIGAQKKSCILVNETLHSTPKGFKYIFLPKLFTSRYRRFIGSCNGIVCLTDNSGGDIHLWNPSTKHYKIVPEPDKYPDLYGSRCIGFGYDSISDDYKILCIEFQEGHDHDDRVRAQLFSTKGGFWREIVVNITLPKKRYANGPVINGILYFEVKKSYNDLISFNLHNEEFNIVPLPSCDYDKKSNLLDFEGSLAIIAYDSIDQGFYEWESDSILRELHVWTLDQNNCEMSWIKTSEMPLQFRIDYDSLIELYLGNGQFYGARYSDSMTPGFDNHSHFWYNYKTKEVSSYFFLQSGECPLVLKYTESLVSLQGFKSTEPIENRHSRNSSIMGYSQQGYHAQATTNLAPLRQQQHGDSSTPGYGNNANPAPRMHVFLNQQGQGYTHNVYGSSINKVRKSHGVIIGFSNERGYGFIRPDKGGKDLFVHVSDITFSESFRNGQAVEFKVEFDSQKNKYKAVNVVIINTRCAGVVTRFSDEKGFGFIQPNKGGKELFVHHSEIIMSDEEKDYPTLWKGYDVEFTVIFDSVSNKNKAADVTGINGSPIVYMPPKKLAGGVGECFKCGQPGHMAKDCNGGSRSEVAFAGKGRSAGSGGSGGGNCYKCGKPGHFERDCLTILTRGGRRGGGGRGGRKCFICGKQGHCGRDCPSGTSEKSNY